MIRRNKAGLQIAVARYGKALCLIFALLLALPIIHTKQLAGIRKKIADVENDLRPRVEKLEKEQTCE